MASDYGSRSGRTHDADGNPYGRIQKRFNDTEEAIARKLFGKCTLFCGDVECRRGCINPTGDTSK